MKYSLFVIVSLPSMIFGTLTEDTLIATRISNEDRSIQPIIDIINTNLKTNKWDTNIMLIGHLPETFFSKIILMGFSVVVANIDREGSEIGNIMPFYSKFIVIRCVSFDDFELKLRKVMDSPFWHPHANIILDYVTEAKTHQIAKIFYILWYFKAPNAIIMHYDNSEDILIYNYNPYTSEKYVLSYSFSCWTNRNIGVPVTARFEQSFRCMESCQNLSLHSRIRADHFGTCIGFKINRLSYGDREAIKKLNLFEDIGKNLNGYALRAYSTEVLPFLRIHELSNGTYSLHARDGLIWNAISKLMNFSIDLSPSLSLLKQPMNFELIIKEIFSFSLRKTDLFLIPIYQYDIIIAEIDYTFPFQDSGICFMSHRADFNTILFDFMFLWNNYVFIIQFTICFFTIWFVFSLFNIVEARHFNYDQLGKDMMNTVRNFLLISLYKPPKRKSFRIFLSISIWCFFILSFATQAAVISFFASIKRGKEIDTYDDINEKAHIIERMASPDILLPESEEKFWNNNMKLVPIQDIFGCVRRMNIDNRRLCLIDCSVGRYLERNTLNEKGEQFLHIAKDKMHSYYLNMIFPKYSVLTKEFNKYMRMIVEAGLIQRWEQYKYTNIKDKVQIKPLSLEYFQSVLWLHYFILGLTIIIFLCEVILGNRAKLICFK